ncbi:MAG TPA: hypothetical protein VFU23_15025, partial [Gemmatimonadales bacterium]|nr:hypothetical protein [Gemmatimonadales bacterium]
DAAPLIEQLLHGRGDVEVRAGGEEAAGVRGEAADGSVVIDNTLPRRLEQRRGALAIELTARIEAP